MRRSTPGDRNMHDLSVCIVSFCFIFMSFLFRIYLFVFSAKTKTKHMKYYVCNNCWSEQLHWCLSAVQIVVVKPRTWQQREHNMHRCCFGTTINKYAHDLTTQNAKNKKKLNLTRNSHDHSDHIGKNLRTKQKQHLHRHWLCSGAMCAPLTKQTNARTQHSNEIFC